MFEELESVAGRIRAIPDMGVCPKFFALKEKIPY